MSLSAALSIAQRSLLSSSRQTTVVSHNVTNAQNPDYARRSAVLVSTAAGGTVVAIQRAANDSLFRSNLAAVSSFSAQSLLSGGLDALALQINGVDNLGSAAALIGRFQQALQSYATTPSNENLAENAVEAARQLAQSLNHSTDAIQAYRARTDQAIATSVASLNDLLSRFEQANKAVIKATQSGTDPSDALDQRDSLLKQIAELVPVSAITRSSNDMVLTTTSGVTLFETVPRAVSFVPTLTYSPGSTGNGIYVDGVPLVPGSGANTDASGSLSAMLQLRDTVTVNLQTQLDEIARGLIVSMAELDQSGAALPPQTGLFTWSGGPALPPDGLVSVGIAGQIAINPAMDSTAGGAATVLRDGGANGGPYVANALGVASFADLLLSYSERLDSPIAFDPAAGLDSNASVTIFSESAVSWIELARQQATGATEVRNAQMTRTAEALSNETGVNIDEELSLLLDLEHAYQASSKLLASIDEMLKNLLAVV